jgi:hypothetical protein
MESLAEAAKEDYQAEVKKSPREEWAVRRGVLTTARDLKVIDDFMNNEPKLTSRGKGVVESLRENCKKRAGLMEGAVKMGRYELADAELEADRQLTKERLHIVEDIGRIIDD